MQKVLSTYKDRLINLSSKNKSLVCKLYKKSGFDIVKLLSHSEYTPTMLTEDKLFEWLLSNNKKLLILPEASGVKKKFISSKKKKLKQSKTKALNQLKAKKNKLEQKNPLLSEQILEFRKEEKNINDSYEAKMIELDKEGDRLYTQLQNHLDTLKKSLSRTIDTIEKATGKYELYLTYPFVEGKFKDGTIVRAPLLLFPVELIFDNRGCSLKKLNNDILINKVFIYAYIKYNDLKNININTEFSSIEEIAEQSNCSIHNPEKLKKAVITYLAKNHILIEEKNEQNIIEFHKMLKTQNAYRHYGNNELITKNYVILGQFSLANAIYSDYENLLTENDYGYGINTILGRENKAITPPSESKQEASYFYTPLDFSQEEAIKSLNKHKQMVIYGPPGTGKSYTIANIITDALCRGKKVLMVSKKRVALDVIYNKLADFNEKIILIHDIEKNKKTFYEKTKKLLDMPTNNTRYKSSQKKYQEFQVKIEENFKNVEYINRFLSDNTKFGLSLREMYLKSTKINSKEDKRYELYLQFIKKNPTSKLNYQQLQDILHSLKAEQNIDKNYKAYRELKEQVKYTDLLNISFDLSEINKSEESADTLKQYINNLEVDDNLFFAYISYYYKYYLKYNKKYADQRKLINSFAYKTNNQRNNNLLVHHVDSNVNSDKFRSYTTKTCLSKETMDDKLDSNFPIIKIDDKAYFKKHSYAEMESILEKLSDYPNIYIKFKQYDIAKNSDFYSLLTENFSDEQKQNIENSGAKLKQFIQSRAELSLNNKKFISYYAKNNENDNNNIVDDFAKILNKQNNDNLLNASYLHSFNKWIKVEILTPPEQNILINHKDNITQYLLNYCNFNAEERAFIEFFIEYNETLNPEQIREFAQNYNHKINSYLLDKSNYSVFQKIFFNAKEIKNNKLKYKNNADRYYEQFINLNSDLKSLEKKLSNYINNLLEYKRLFQNYQIEFQHIYDELQHATDLLDKFSINLTTKIKEQLYQRFYQNIDIVPMIDKIITIIDNEALNTTINEINALDEDLYQLLNIYLHTEDFSRSLEDSILEIERRKEKINYKNSFNHYKEIYHSYYKKILKFDKLLNEFCCDLGNNKEKSIIQVFLKNTNWESCKQELLKEIDNIINTLNLDTNTLNNYRQMDKLDSHKKNILDYHYEEMQHISNLNDCLNMIEEFAILAKIEKIEKTKNYKQFYNQYFSYNTTINLLENDMQKSLNLTKKIALGLWKNKFNELIKTKEFSSSQTEYKEFIEFKRKANFKKKYIPLREYINKFNEFIFNLYPCWLLSPETVSEILPLHQKLFDLVIFDEASQLFIEETLPSIYRGNMIAVAGDDKQLKPSNYFTSKINEDYDEDDLDINNSAALEEESLLDLAKVHYKSNHLNYHYRSHYGALINFSNYAFYNGNLNIVPDVISSNNMPKPAIEVKKVNGIWQDNVNEIEAKEIVNLVELLLRTRKNNETIGIITFSAKQQDLIADLLEDKASDDEYFSTLYLKEKNRLEKNEDVSIFIKNIENVQGDERDIIIFSITYAKNEEGKLSSRFGVLNNAGGENYLNVAISRAKQKIYIITSFDADELNIESSKNIGPKLFKQYLQYAKAIAENKTTLADEILTSLQIKESTTAIHKDKFVEEVAKELKIRGYRVETNVGVGKIRLDIAILYPENNNYILGIECDSKNYQSIKSVKEREIYRKKFFMSRGWTIKRIWSEKWWRDKETVINEINQLFTKLQNNN